MVVVVVVVVVVEGGGVEGKEGRGDIDPFCTLRYTYW